MQKRRFPAIPRLVRSVLLVLILGAVGRVQAADTTVPWTLRADWSGGYSGWMSFPLAQDIGFDPSIYTEKRGTSTALIHNFLSHGESQAWFGLIRPATFLAGPAAHIELQYRLEIAGARSEFELILVGGNGHKYFAALPSGDGEHEVQITGAELGLSTLMPMEAIVLRGRLHDPPAGSESHWTLEQFVLHGARRPEVALSLPHLAPSVDGAWVAHEIVSPGDRMEIELVSAGSPAQVSLYNPAGNVIATQAIASGHKQASIEMGPHPTPGLWRAEVTQGQGKTTFRFLVLGEISAHPRLLLSKWRLDQLSHDARYAEIRRQVHRRAMALASQITYNPAAGDNIELMPSGPGIKPGAAGQLSPYVELVNAYSDAIAYNALDYRLNGDAAALAAARRALHALVQWHAWVPPRFRSHGLETYYQVGVIVQQVALGYDLIADQLSPQEREDVAQAFWEKVIQPTVQEYFLYNRDPIGASNWMANSVGGALAAAVAVAGDVPEWNQREAPAVAQLQFAFEQLLGGLFPGDGSEAEPTGYENFAMQGVSWGMTALAALDIRPRGTDQMLAGFWWPYYDTVRPGMELDTGDFDGHLKGLSGFAWSAEHAGIPELRALYDGGTQLDLSRGATTDRNGHLLEEMLGPLDLACCSEPARAFKAPPPSRVFPGRGSAALRSGWEPDATVVSIRVGPWFNHEHSDEGSFQVAAFGEKLIDEAGYANYYTDPNYPDYFTQAAGHNTLLVDRDPFSQAAFNGRYWSGFEYPHFSAWLLGTSFDYLSADLTAAYDGRVQSYQREFVFLKPGVLVVCDRVRAVSPHVFSWLLHTPAGSKLATVGTHASIQTVHAYASLTAAGPNTIWTTALTPIALEAFKDLDRQHIEPLRELVLSSAKVTATQFIVAIKLGKGTTSPQPEMESWREASGEGLRAISGSPSSIIFRTGNGPLRIASVATDGSVLAWLGGDSSWLAIGARSVEDSEQVLLRATAPTDLTWERSPSGLELSLHNGAPDTIQVFNAVAPVSVDIDGQRVSASYMDGMVTLPALAAGEHHVSIR